MTQPGNRLSHLGGILNRMGFAFPSGLSPSAVTAFKNCPLAFRFAYIDRVPQPPSIWATKGSVVHRALELLMLSGPAERTKAKALKALELAYTEYNDHPDLTDLSLSDEEMQQFRDDTRGLVERYFELEDPTTVRPIGLELRLGTEIGSLKLRGIIDRLELTADGDLVVTDYKTGVTPHENYEQSRLLGVHFYSLLCERNFGTRPVRVQLLYLSKPEAIIATPSVQSVAGSERKTSAVWSAIARACTQEDFRPKPGRLCDYCAFRPYCPAWGGNPDDAPKPRAKEELQLSLVDYL